jgi:hypothetical protein
MGQVSVGFFSFTEVTDPAQHHAYNEWHQLDHMPEQHVLAGIVLGQRWVATPPCRAARLVSAPLLDPTHYMTLYLMADPIEETLSQFFDLGARLRAAGRFFDARRSHLSGPFALVEARAAPGLAVSGEALPFRANRGVYVVVEAGAGTEDEQAQRSRTTHLLEVDGVAGVWRFKAERPTDGRWRSGDHTITLCYLDADPLAVAQDLGPVLDGGAVMGAEPVLAGPFESIRPWEWSWFDERG